MRVPQIMALKLLIGCPLEPSIFMLVQCEILLWWNWIAFVYSISLCLYLNVFPTFLILIVFLNVLIALVFLSIWGWRQFSYIYLIIQEVLVRFFGFGSDEDEWVNVKNDVRERSIPLDNWECQKVKPGDDMLCLLVVKYPWS